MNALLLIEQTPKEKPWWMCIQQWSYEFKINTIKCEISYLYISLLLTVYLCLSVHRSLENTFWLQQGSIWNEVQKLILVALILITNMEKQAVWALIMLQVCRLGQSWGPAFRNVILLLIMVCFNRIQCPFPPNLYILFQMLNNLIDPNLKIWVGSS